jgi:vacuolar-type H+-ATPase subunit H
VSLFKTNRTTAGMAAVGARAKDAAAQAVPAGKRAGTTAVQGARQGAADAKDWAVPRVQDAKEWAVPRVQDAKEWAVPRVQDAKDWAAPLVQDAVRGAREWAAPRLEDAAEAVTTTVAPKVSSALRSTASQVRPAPAKTGVRRLLDWRWLLGLGAVLGVAGATAGVAMRRRYARATAAAKDATEPDVAAQAAGDDTGAEASSVNGRVTTPEA